jgi:hypothetical protein
VIPASVTFHMPTEIISGVGEVVRVGQLARHLGKRAVVVSTPQPCDLEVKGIRHTLR